MKYSIIIPNLNNVHYLVQAVSSVVNHTEDYELIVVDNASTDGSQEYVKGLHKLHSNVKCIELKENKGFGGATNEGFRAAKGDFLVWLNNDTIVTPNWLPQTYSAMRRYERKNGVRIGLVGPATNFAGGRQQAQGIQYTPHNVAKFSEGFHKAHIDNLDETGFLSGFCIMMKRKLYEEVGDLDEDFFPGGFEDNDYLLRANEKGWYALIAGDTFVHHYGSKTMSTDAFKDRRGGLANRFKFYKKWEERNKGDKKLVAMYRVKSPDEYFVMSLNKTSEFADAIVVLVDNPAPGDQTVAICEQLPKVVKIHVSTEPFDERRDRNKLVEMAMAEGADWMISIDDDEVFEDSFDRKRAQQLMHPPNPHVKMYGFHWKTFFNGTTHFRTDGIFGNMYGYRMVKVEPGRTITGGTGKGLHCGNLPSQPAENLRFTGIRIKHYGYCTPQKCKEKYEWYQRIDDEKIEGLIGQEDYSHLIQKRINVYPWEEDHALTLLMAIRNGGDQFCEVLEHMGYFADKILVGDTGSTDTSMDIAKMYGAEIHPTVFEDSYSKLKNQLIDKCKTQWILLMDYDESFDYPKVPRISNMMDTDWDGYMFQVLNHQRNGQISFSEAVRLFRNIPEMRYTGRVHENFDDVMFAGEVNIAKAEFPLHHYGFTLSAAQMDAKLEIYKRLNELQMKEFPKDARAPFNLALHYLNEGNYSEGMKLLKFAITLNPQFYQPKKELGLSYIRMGQKWLQEALVTLPEDHLMKELIQRILSSITNVIGEQDLKIGTPGMKEE